MIKKESTWPGNSNTRIISQFLPKKVIYIINETGRKRNNRTQKLSPILYIQYRKIHYIIEERSQTNADF